MESTKNCVELALEIPIVRSASSNLRDAYKTIKKINKASKLSLELTEECLNFAWQGLNPVMGRLQKPIEFADELACLMLDEVMVKYPKIMEPTDKLIESSTKVVLHSSLTQKALVGLEKALGLAEAIVSLVPSIAVSEEEADEDTSLISRTMKPVKHCYFSPIWPLRRTAKYLRSRRSEVTEIVRLYLPGDDIFAHHQRDMWIRTLAENIFFIPRSFLRYIGKTTFELGEIAYQVSDYQPSESDQEVDQLPSDDTASNDKEDPTLVDELNKSVNTSATDDTIFHACLGEQVSDEYHSGTDGDSDDETDPQQLDVESADGNNNPEIDDGTVILVSNMPASEHANRVSLDNVPIIVFNEPVVLDPNPDSVFAPHDASQLHIDGYPHLEMQDQNQNQNENANNDENGNVADTES